MTRSARSAQRRPLLAGTALFAGGLLLAACGSSGTTDTAAPSTSGGSAATSTPATTGGATSATTAFGPGCAAVPTSGAGSFSGMAQAPAATAASNNPVLSTLVSAVGQAGLVDTLNGPGPFTIFAPTNDAFAALPPDALNKVLADKTLLTEVLTYHVIPGNELDAMELGKAGGSSTVEGDQLKFSADGTMVNNASVVCSDVTTANATVHIINQVLLPPKVAAALGASTATTAGAMQQSPGSGSAMAALTPHGSGCAAVPTTGPGSFTGMAADPAATAASNNPLLSTLVSAVKQAQLVDTLNGPGPFTIFAPTNDAFAALPAGALNSVMADKKMLTTVLTNHVISGSKLDAKTLESQGKATTVAGTTLTFTTGADGTLMVNGKKSVCMDVPTANAVVHIIDGVLLPS